MNSPYSKPGRGTIKGTVQTFAGEALLFPTGLLTAIFLTRSLGPHGYGLFTVAATIITWIEWSATSIFSRTTIKFVSEAEDWRPVGTTVLQQHLLVSASAAFLLCLSAVPIATLLGEPQLTAYLLLFAPEIILFAAARAHRSILMGLGGFSGQAIAGASRWIARLILMVFLVGLGFSVPGAILGSVGASLVELVFSRFYVRPSLFCDEPFPVKKLWDYAWPLFLYSLSMRFYDKLDLLMLKVLGGTAEQAGIYGAAQNLSLIPTIFALSFGPVLLSNLTRTLRLGEIQHAKKMSREAMRLVLLILPFAALTAGTSSEIVGLIFGEPFLPAAPLLAVLMFGAVAFVGISVNTAILIAADKPNWTFAFTGPMVPLAAIGHLLIIPKLGAIGASAVTTSFAFVGATATVLAVYRIWRILPPFRTLLRSILVCGLIYAVAAYCSAPGFWLLLKLPALALLIPLAFLLTGEFTKSDIALFRSQLPWQNVS